ncbi:class I SAM-dependent methyltransferase [Achromobacter animicus]|uniref:class I SAM-dependent methyltransferase n=1 Tax=Achromobacter animicus TaxID=1389935 RepID=UPI00244A66F6|nr:methyltransferase domain-containing protein [Achromobacter animicus]MDH0682749.1 methyltransferase domain-containing protein [Achromobacter animicus]
MKSSQQEKSATGAPARSPLIKWLSETKDFVAALVSNPGAVGAVLPSGPVLASAITASVQPGPGRILELGCGTGVFTREILRKGIDQSRLILIEQDPVLTQRLRHQFPHAMVLQMPAENLDGGTYPELDDVETTVCGLPLLNMTSDQHERLMQTVFDVMKPKGAMYLFTYGLRCPISQQILDKYGLAYSRVRFVALNLPPASVYRLSRRLPEKDLRLASAYLRP